MTEPSSPAAADPPAPVAAEAGRLLFAKPCDFVLGAARLDQLPAPDRPEIAFAGRSNVGKSSLLNALLGRKSLARTSNTPGRTREINFFDLDGFAYLVDLPGYGYAEVPKEVAEAWTGRMKDYLRGRPSLRRALLLIDARHGAKRNDVDIMEMFDRAAVSFQVVLTKADKLKTKELDRRIDETVQAVRQHVAGHPRMVVTSSLKGKGLGDLRAEIAAVLWPELEPTVDPAVAPDGAPGRGRG